ncbi:MAG TPA: hypothetical protein PLK02_06380 [Paludibacteraceae bacterium]|nr:hypothetical protein [Paludibacteraceae bacterium]HPL94709.1 hypothetical protein [Paludibacteraceae bacterium]
MTDELIKYHALEFFRQHSRYLSEDSIFDIERDLRNYQVENRKLYEFKYQDAIEIGILKTYLLDNDIIIFKESARVTGERLYGLSEYGKELLKRNKEHSYQ